MLSAWLLLRGANHSFSVGFLGNFILNGGSCCKLSFKRLEKPCREGRESAKCSRSYLVQAGARLGAMTLVIAAVTTNRISPTFTMSIAPDTTWKTSGTMSCCDQYQTPRS